MDREQNPEIIRLGVLIRSDKTAGNSSLETLSFYNDWTVMLLGCRGMDEMALMAPSGKMDQKIPEPHSKLPPVKWSKN